MKGKIFKVIGIVLAAIVAFVGIVVGVMAIQGKFKKQIIYPSELIFETNNFVVVNDDTIDDVKLHSFILTGRNGNKTVNQKTCYIKFVEQYNNPVETIFGEELITLCNADKTPLTKISSQTASGNDVNFVGSYKVECNEPIYYTFKPMGSNPVHYSRTNFGKVVLEAYDQTNMVKSNQLVFNVDKAVEQIKLKGEDYKTELTGRPHGTQSKVVQLGGSFEFDFDIEPFYALRPYSDNANEKEIEIYYNDTSKGDYQLVDSMFLENNEFVKDADGKLVFEPKTAGAYQFVYAVFDSYEAKENCPNTMFNYERVQDYMVYTILDISVISEMAESVTISESANLNFKLYENNNLSLNANQALQANNLGLTINNGATSKLFDAIEFNTGESRFWTDTNISFSSADNSILLTKNAGEYNYRINANNLQINSVNYTINYDNENKIDLLKGTLIDSLSANGVTYKCKNGIAFVDNNGHINLLRVGSYLDFVTVEDNTYTKSSMDYTAKINNRNGAFTTFDMLIKTLPEENKDLHLMALLVNSDGTYKFDTKECLVSTNELQYSLEQQDVELIISYSQNNTNFGEEKFDNIVSILGGTYTAGVLMIEQNDQNEYSICVLPEFTYFNAQNGKTYVLVGVVEDGEFKNVVRAKDRAGNSGSTIYLMQLKNAYGQTTEQFINAKNEAGNYTFNSSEVANLYLATPISVENNYQLTGILNYDFNASSVYEADEDKDNYIYKDTSDCYHILEKTGNHTLKINSNYLYMLSNIFDKLKVENFACYINVNGNWQLIDNLINIKTIELNEAGFIVVNFDALNYDEQISTFYLGLTYNDANYYSPKLAIDSQEVQNIKFYCNGLEQELPTVETATLPTITATITGIENGNYKVQYFYNGQEIADIKQLFNLVYDKSSFANSGFAPTPAYSSDIKEYRFSYSSLDSSIVNLTSEGGLSLEILKVGSCNILIRCNDYEAEGFIRLNITADYDAFKFAYADSYETKSNTEKNSVKLSDLINYLYNEEAITESKYFTISNIKCGNYVAVEQDGGFAIKDGTGDTANTYLTILVEDDVWTVKRTFAHSNLNVSFDVAVATYAAPIKVNIYFSSAISVELNSNYNATIYAETTVLMAELAKNNADFKNNSLFRIKESQFTTNSYKITYSKDDGDEGPIGTYFTSTDENITNVFEVGNYVFKIYSSETASSDSDILLASYNIIVAPNVVFSQTNEQKINANALESDSSYELKNLVTIKKFDTKGTYGLDVNYTAEKLIDIENLADLPLEFKDNSFNGASILTLDENKTDVSTLWLEDLDEQITQTLKLCLNTTSFDLSVQVVNKYAKMLTYEDSPFTISARVEYEKTPISIVYDEEEWVLTAIEANGYTFTVNDSHKFSLNQDLPSKVDNASLTFKFALSSGAESEKTLIYKNANNQNGNVKNITITLTPNTPPPSTEQKMAYSNSQFDIFKDVFDLDSASGIESIRITSATNGNLFASQVVGLTYNFNNPTDNLITFNEISGNEQKSIITYQITYTGGQVAYNHEYTLTILNRQELTLTYPYSEYGQGFNVIGLRARTNDSATSEYLNNISTLDCYELVNAGQTITFGNSARAKVKNRLENGAELQNEISSVEWVAYTGLYYSGLVTISSNENDFNVTFNSTDSITSCYIILKITTKSGNYDFYVLHYYNQKIDPRYIQTNANYTWSINVEPGATFYSTSAILGQTFDRDVLYNQFKLQGITPTENNFQLYLLEASLLGVEGNAYEKLNIEQFSRLNGKTLTALTQFATLKIALIYNGTQDNAEIYLGNILAYVKSDKNVELNNENVKTSLDNITNGNYVYLWQTSANRQFANPFSLTKTPTLEIVSVSDEFKIENNSIYLKSDSENSKQIIAISNTDVVRQQYITFEYSFVVKYTYDFDGEQLVLFVTFNMQATEPPTNTLNRTIGYTNGEFVDSIILTFNGYKGGISYDNNENVSFSYNSTSGELTLTFKLKTDAYHETIKIVYTEIANAELSRTINVTVESAVYISFPSGSNGSNENAPLTATMADESTLYSTENASSIDIVQKGNSYSIDNLTITTKDPSTLDLTINSNANFVTSQSATKINFAHNAKDNVVVEILIKIKSGNVFYKNERGEEIVVHLFIKVPKTYVGLKATYLTDEEADHDSKTNTSDHENVLSGQAIDNILNNLLSQTPSRSDAIDNKSINSSSRVSLIDLNGNIKSDATLISMGFINSNNANYLKIDPNPDSSMVKTLSDNKLTFPSITERNTLTSISLSNEAGVNGISYNYQVMKVAANAEKLIDGLSPLDAANEEYIYSTTYANSIQTVDYSFVINKKDSAVTKFSTELLTIANLLDENNTAFYITSLNVYKKETNLQKQQSSKRDVNSESNIITYNLNFENYTLVLTRTANMQIQVQLTDNNANTSDEQLSFEFTFVGNGGEFKLSLNFYYCTITDASQTLTAGTNTTIDLSSFVVSNATGRNFDVTFEYERNGSSYTYLNRTQSNIQATNNLYKVEFTTNKKSINLSLYTIISRADINIKLKVLYKEKLIGYLDIFIIDECGFQYKLNDNQIIDGTSATYANVYYLWLNIPSDTRTFNKQITLMGEQSSLSQEIYNEITYYDGLNIKLFNISNQIGLASISISTVDGDGVQIQNDATYRIQKTGSAISLNFTRDYTGDIILKLSATTSNGDYVRYLCLKVLGYITLTYADSNNQNTILDTTGGNGYNSNTPVNLIDTSTVNQTTGLVISTTDDNGYEMEVSTKISYVIVPYQANMDVAKVYDESKQHEQTNITATLKKGRYTFILKHNLPIVPMSSNQETYVVIYKISLGYLGQSTDKYYVAYRVHNDLKVSAQNTNINADNQLLGGSKLQLFKFYLTYTANYKDYILYYDGSKLQLVDEDKKVFTYDEDETLENNAASFKNGEDVITISSLTSLTNLKVNVGGQAYDAIVTLSEQTDKDIVYTTSYTNIEEFREFIDNCYIRIVANSESNYAGPENRTDGINYLYYKLENLNKDGEYGVFGIDIKTYYRDAASIKSNSSAQTLSKLFNNEFFGELQIMDKTSDDKIASTALHLNSNNTLTATGFTVNEIFGTNYGEAENYLIIGFGSPQSTWVSNATGTSGSSSVATISYKNKNYSISRATWTNTSISNSIYNLSKQFYYIDSPSSLITVNYFSGEADRFIVGGQNFTNGSISSDNMIYSYSNGSGGMTRSEVAGTLSQISNEQNNSLVSISSNQVSVTWDNLVKYKHDNPDKSFLTINCTLSYNDTEFTIEIAFKLPTNQTICITNLTNSTLTGERAIEISDENNKIQIPVEDSYEELTTDNANLISSITETGTDYTQISINRVGEGKTAITITIDLNKVKTYFDNGSAYLQISFSITTAEGTVMNFDILIQKPKS